MTTHPPSAPKRLQPQPWSVLAAPVIVVGAALAIAIGLVWRARGELPDPVAVHWGVDGAADRFEPLGQHLIFGSVFTLVMTAFLLAVGAAVRQVRQMAAFGSGMGVFLAVVLVGSTLGQRGIGDVHAARDRSSLLVGLAIAAVVGALVWFVVRPREVPAAARPSVLPSDAAVLGVGDAVRVAWTGRTRVTGGAYAMLAATTVLMLGMAAALAVLGNWQVGMFVLLVYAAVAVLGSSMWSRVVVDGSGVTVRGLGVVRWAHVPLATIESAGVAVVDPLGEFGGYGIRAGLDGSAGVVTGAGEALRIKRAGERPFYVTVDDARSAAAVLNTLLLRQKADV